MIEIATFGEKDGYLPAAIVAARKELIARDLSPWVGNRGRIASDHRTTITSVLGPISPCRRPTICRGSRRSSVFEAEGDAGDGLPTIRVAHRVLGDKLNFLKLAVLDPPT